MPQWDGEDLNDRTLLVWREEGIGDEMRFASILRDLRDSANFRLVVECGHRLRTLFERSFPGIEFRDENPAGGDFGEFDYHLPIMSLVRFFRRSLNEFPAEGAYLKPDPARVDRWLARLSEIGPQPKIGIGWRSLSKSWRKAPLLTRLEDWDRITGRSDLIIVNLQCEDVDDEITAATRRLGRDIHRFDDVDIKNDIEEAAALMAALDTVIGARCWVPTTAGAVGTKAFCVTPRPNPFMMNLAYDPWSPTTDIFYRDFDDDWDGVISEIDAAIDDFNSASNGTRQSADTGERA